MSPCWYVWSCRMVALLAEGVDRNPWRCVSGRNSRVALLAEGVDRNTLLLTFDVERDSRPPRGGRG